MSEPIADQPARDRILNELDRNFVVEAAAGTGKTTVLVQRIVAVVRTGRATLGQLIAVTFTEKAAGEMKLRLRAQLESERNVAADDTPERARLTRALEELEVARISTIHGLCADLLREYPIEAGVDPLFEVADEDESNVTLQLAFSRWFEAALRDPPEGVRRLLRRRSRFSDDSPRSMLFGALRQLSQHRDFDGAWQRPSFNRDALIDALMPTLERLGLAEAYVTARPGNWFVGLLAEVHRFCDDVKHRESVTTRDYDGLEASLKELRGNRAWENSAMYVKSQGMPMEEIELLKARALQLLDELVQASDADIAALLQQELKPVLDAYAAEKSRRGTLDFVDILLKTRDLQREHATVRRLLQQRFTHLFIDEFQDTDPLQAELLLLMAASDPNVDEPFKAVPLPGKLFVVGDPKQSIYRFRRADIVLYEHVKQHLIAHGAALEHLSTSFRSTPALQAAINGAFSAAMQEKVVGRPDYVALQKFRKSPDAQPSLVALPVTKPYNERGKINKYTVEDQVPDITAAFIEFLVTKSGWTVEERGTRVPIEPRHICILFKRLRGFRNVDLSQGYATALEARRVPHVLVGGRSFHAREEVLALRNALRAVEWPDDELAVFATLRGPFFALSDEALLVFRHEYRRMHPLRPFEKPLEKPAEVVALVEPVVDALAVLGALHRQRNKRHVSGTIHAFLEATRAHAGMAFWKAGAQALANVMQLADRARQLETRATSFRDVVERLEAEAAAGESSEAPIVEEGTEGVRMMTVHGAKGLEFPVVILAEPTANVSRKTPSHWVDTERRVWAQSLAGCMPLELLAHAAEVQALDREESLRLSYVAATRARDLLVVPAVADEQLEDTWTEVLYPSLYPTAARAQQPNLAPGCPDFGSDTVVDRICPRPLMSPTPGLHHAQTGTHRVVWWDSQTLSLGIEATGGLEADEALKPAPDGTDGAAPYRAWQAAHATVTEAASKPTVRVYTAREVTMPPPTPFAEEATVAVTEGRPKGTRFGTLVHTILSTIDLEAPRADIAKEAAVVARVIGAPKEEQSAAIDAVWAALQHPVLRRASKADDVRREAPISHRLPDGSMIEGLVDLAFLEAGLWTVVDFKTDASLDENREHYQAQLGAYVEAIAEATKLPVTGVLLQV